MFSTSRRNLMRAAMIATLTAAPWPTLALPYPTGPVVLRVRGDVRETNDDKQAAFDMAMLAQLPQHSFVTLTPWYPKARKFTGPLLRDVLAAVGASGQQIEALALNDYKVIIPIADANKHPVIVARLMDDQPMPLRDKGPLFVIYPFDSKPELRTNIYYGRSIWQLKSLTVR